MFAMIKIQRGFLAVVVTWTLAGCSNPTLPAPVVFHDGRVNPCARVAEPERTTKVQLFYATGRIPDGKPSQPSYTNDASKHLRLGVATVQFGKEGTTFEELCAASAGGKDKLPIKTVGVQEMAGISNAIFQAETDEVLPDEAQWLAAVNRQLDRTPNKQINIYLHGCNTSFEGELLTAAPFFH